MIKTPLVAFDFFLKKCFPNFFFFLVLYSNTYSIMSLTLDFLLPPPPATYKVDQPFVTHASISGKFF
jgi:hypothetical protein